MAVKFFSVTTEEEITYLANLAYDIWQEYWPDRIGQAQTDYMIELFQSKDAITHDLAENNYEYWLICVADEEDASAAGAASNAAASAAGAASATAHDAAAGSTDTAGASATTPAANNEEGTNIAGTHGAARAAASAAGAASNAAAFAAGAASNASADAASATAHDAAAGTDKTAGKNSAPIPYPHNVKGRIVGFTGGHVEPETNRFFISKVYLLAEERGRGYASKTIAFYNDLCKTRGLRAMYLTVNKDNDLGIRAYEGKGFITIDATETDIGGGFIMDDYIMEKVAE